MDIKDLTDYNFGKTAQSHKKTEEARFRPSFIQKNLSSIIDGIVVFVIRFVIAVVFGYAWYSLRLKEVFSHIDFTKPDFFDILLKLGIVYEFIIFAFFIIISGGFYYIVLYSTKFSATLGSMLFNLKLVDKKTGARVSFFRSFLRYLLCLMPLFFIYIIVVKYYRRDLDIVFLILVFASVIWYDLWMILRIQGGVPDLIIGTKFVSTKPRIKKNKLFGK